ncbi:pantoate--beta-alanine ligase [Sphingomicrobium clamense]|uniref:Pantothenate synthetase n=1 Tax=Sphingomicrobium clamense TaxID=2851013 RepID=A0ABS6V8C0_9SPHN|nr:pantoate--beta-alanine ligase [Sphingomicrobium sp. B8]
MQTINGYDGLEKALSALREGGQRIAMVPTMGALHDGHLALVARAKEVADKVVVSIFVNPLQFNDKGDLDRYPRQVESDAAKLEAAGADLLWLPTSDDFYPQGYATTISVAGVSEPWEGAHRPGHFDGVATVVAKLFTGIAPDVAVFGEKDWQQLAVIRRMNADLGLGVDVVGHPTVRAEDGLALSSRNALLSEEERQAAATLPDALKQAGAAIAAGTTPAEALAQVENRLANAGFGKVDYVAYVDPDSLEPLDMHQNGARLIAAVFLGKVRLIDNMRVE